MTARNVYPTRPRRRRRPSAAIILTFFAFWLLAMFAKELVS